MEKWKVAVIVALLAALPVYGYFQSKPPGGRGGESSPTPEPTQKTAPPPPEYLQYWVGKKPPPFKFPQELWANTDKPITLDKLKGKVVLLELWRANCSHCQEAAPTIERLAEHNKDKGLVVVGIHSSAEKGTIEYDWKAIQQKMEQMGVEYPVAYDEQRKVFNDFKAKKFPSLFIIDRQGIIRYAHEGMTNPLRLELEAALRQILAGKNPVWPPTKAESAEDAALKYAPDKK